MDQYETTRALSPQVSNPQAGINRIELYKINNLLLVAFLLFWQNKPKFDAIDLYKEIDA